MSTLRLQLHWTGGTVQRPPIANVSLHRYSTLDDGTVVLTVDCMTPRELDQAIDHLIADLEAVRKKGRHRFNKPT